MKRFQVNVAVADLPGSVRFCRAPAEESAGRSGKRCCA